MDNLTPGFTNPIVEFAQGLKRNWGLILLLGILFIIAGIISIAYPWLTTSGIIIMIGWIILIGGVFRLIDAFASMAQGGFIWKIFSSVLYILAGIVLLKFPLSGAITLTLILGIFFIIEGIAKSAFAAEFRPLPGWNWAMFDGVITIIFGILVLAFLSHAAYWLIGLLLGIKLLFAGWDLVFLGLVLKKA